jgi:hypothetical protein
MASSLTAEERETVVTFNDAEDLAYIMTHRSTDYTRLKNNPAAVCLREGKVGSTKWAEFSLPKEFVSFRSKKKTASVKQIEAGKSNIEVNRRVA